VLLLLVSGRVKKLYFSTFRFQASIRGAQPGMNPAEFVIDLVSIDHESQTQAMKVQLQGKQVNPGG